ncbi:neutral/alkaline ceramidase [Zooshikella sp. RANM57]|uniref:neutral/alkaline ceramidase n=1 Tax=Zooshikella sp. RANM57 TaxID=3425863 RepID=UPI003D6FD868
MKIKIINMGLLIFLYMFSLSLYARFDIGIGKADITGPAAEVLFMGYADLNQVAEGIKSRLWARVFIIKDQITKDRVVYVVIDTGMAFQAVKQAVIARLNKVLPGYYNHRNVVISATHTHSGPGGFSHYALYNITTKGFIKQNFDVIVKGIVNAIFEAHQNLQPGEIFTNQGHLDGANRNRSLQAYLQNKDAGDYPAEDTRMVVLSFKQKGQLVGVLSWFPTHGVSMPKENKLINPDNKGYAAYLFEKYAKDVWGINIVSAFAQSNAGDMTPNINLDGSGPGNTAEKSTKRIGELQFKKARDLVLQSGQKINGNLQYRHLYIDMSKQSVRREFTSGKMEKTCTAALGYAFAAGTEDGRGLDFFHEGQLQENPFWQIITGLLTQPTAQQKTCHAPKPILLAQGNAKPFPWSPEILPISLIQLGQFVVVALPGEFTVMAGRRILQTLTKYYPDARVTVMAGYSNAYSGYITTFEEYNAQHYEGGSTHFGPWTLAAYRQAVSELAQSLHDINKLQNAYKQEPKPRDLSKHQMSFDLPVIHDQAPLSKQIGMVERDAQSEYKTGDEVVVTFWSGHLRNDLRIGKSYLYVEQFYQGQWKTVATDNDWSTSLQWRRVDPIWGSSNVIIRWQIPDNTTDGLYRIRHVGAFRQPITGKVKPYSGVSKTFYVGLK